MSDSNDSFGWVPVKKEIIAETVQLESVKKKKKVKVSELDASRETFFLNSTNQSFTDVKSKNTSKKKEKVSSGTPNSSLNRICVSFNDSESMHKSQERKNGSDEVSLFTNHDSSSSPRKKSGKVKYADVNAKLQLLQSDSDVGKGKKRKRMPENNIGDDISAKQQLLNSDSENESTKKRSKKSNNRKSSNAYADVSERNITVIKSNNSFNKKNQENVDDQSKKVINNSNDSSFLDNFLRSDVYNNQSHSSLRKEKTYSSESNRIDLRSYLFGNKNLSLEKNEMYANVGIEEDDDIWLLSCPQSLSFERLQNLKVNPEGKTKLHFDGKTFECKVKPSNISSRMKNLIVHSNKPGVCKIIAKNIIGNLNICEKINKVKVLIEEDDSTQDKVAFPNLKSRHPFFGPDYKKYVDISPNVVEKLHKANEKKLKRKVKLENISKGFIENNLKKSTTIFHSKVKKLKQEIKSCNDQWESAESIERNLFHIPQISSIKEELNSE